MKLKWSLYSPAWEHAPLMMAVVSPWYSGQCTDSAMNCMFLLAEAFIVSTYPDWQKGQAYCTELVFSQCWHTVLRMAVTHKYSRSLGSCMLLLWSLHKMLIVTFVHCFNHQIIAKDLQNAHVPPGRGNWCWCTIITVMFTKNFTYIIIFLLEWHAPWWMFPVSDTLPERIVSGLSAGRVDPESRYYWLYISIDLPRPADMWVSTRSPPHTGWSEWSPSDPMMIVGPAYTACPLPQKRSLFLEYSGKLADS